MKKKECIGDAVYVDINDCGQIVLTTEDGISISNTIYLEPEVYGSLERYIEAARQVAQSNGR